MTHAVVSGLGEVEPGRRLNVPVERLIVDAIQSALQDANVRASDIGAVISESSLTPAMAPFDRIAPMAGLTNVHYTLQSSPVGAGILAAIGMAFDLVKNGTVNHALTYFGVDWGTQPNGPTGYHAGMEAKRIVETPAGFAGPPLYFGLAARRYQYLHGLSDTELQGMLWDVVDATRYNASHNSSAQVRETLSHEDYLQRSMVAEPLRGPDCSLLSDGAVAMVISRRDGADAADGVGLSGWAYDYDNIPDMDFYSQSPWLPDLPAATRSSERAFRLAGKTVDDIDSFQLYDCFSIAVILQLEAIGVCRRGEGKSFGANGRLRFDGETPVNTHGGLMSHGYLLGANHAAEAVKQIRKTDGIARTEKANCVFVGAGPGRQYTSLIFTKVGT